MFEGNRCAFTIYLNHWTAQQNMNRDGRAEEFTGGNGQRG